MAEHSAVLHLLLTDDYVAVANRGRTFTLEGIKSICGQLRSPKASPSQVPQTAITSQKQANAALEAIRGEWLRLYAQMPGLLERQAIREKAIIEETSGRLLMELIQNVNDANARKLFGKKGIGFSVSLTISDTPRVHSGPASFCFDPEQSRIEIHMLLRSNTPNSLPVIRLPFPCDRKREPKPVRRLLEEHDTVIVLPFRDDDARAAFIAEWNRLIDDPTILYWIPSLTRVIWQRKDKAETFTRMWVLEGKSSVRMIDDGKRTAPANVVVRRPRVIH